MKELTALQKKQRAFLIEGCLHFNSENRSQSSNGTCLYMPATKNTDGCFIGRKIRSKSIKKAIDKYSGDTSVNSVFDSLPKTLQKYGMDFLNSCQKLHDFTANWTETGLSEDGLLKALEIGGEFGLNIKEEDLTA